MAPLVPYLLAVASAHTQEVSDHWTQRETVILPPGWGVYPEDHLGPERKPFPTLTEELTTHSCPLGLSSFLVVPGVEIVHTGSQHSRSSKGMVSNISREKCGAQQEVFCELRVCRQNPRASQMPGLQPDVTRSPRLLSQALKE